MTDTEIPKNSSESLERRAVCYMLDANSFLAWARGLGFPDKTVTAIERIRSSPPSRRVRGGKGNICGRYCSSKMGLIVQFEGWAEHAALYEAEFDQACLEFYDQPPRIELPVMSRTGRNCRIPHTADYFLIYQTEAGWLQCKREEELERIAAEKPNMYQKAADGHWCCPPGEEYAQQFGLKFWVKSTKDYSWNFISNLRFLEDYLATDVEIPEVEQELITSTVKDNPGINISRLKALLPGVKIDSIFQMLVDNRIFMDLRNSRLSEPDFTSVFSTQELGKAFSSLNKSSLQNPCKYIDVVAGESFVWNENMYTILSPGPKEIVIKPCLEGRTFEISRAEFIEYIKQGKIVVSVNKDESIPASVHEILASAGPRELSAANFKYRVIQSILDRDFLTETAKVPERTRRDWIRKYKTAEEMCGYGFVGLIDKHKDQGNRQPRLLPEVSDAINKVIKEAFETLKQPKVRPVYGRLLISLENLGLPMVSYKTFCQYVNLRKGPEQVDARQGSRSAYGQEYRFWYLERETERHGTHPLSIVHIDHTELDIELVHSRTGKVLGRPWLTLAICAYTRRIVGYWLSFDPPSNRACMGVLREIVRRHGRFPKYLIVDNAHEFCSTYFETVTGFYKCHILKRPPAKPRFGSVCERIFGTINTQLIHNLGGNTQIMKEVRKVTKLNDPRNLATWTLVELYTALATYIDEVYDVIEHPALGESPREAFTLGMELKGFREHCITPYDQGFLDSTMVETSKKRLKVTAQGVKIHYNYYWSEYFKKPGIQGKSIPVKFDPYDFSVAKAYIGEWVTCTVNYPNEFKGRSEKEIQMITEELRAQNRRHGKQFAITARLIASNIIDLENTNTKIALQREKDLELKEIFRLICGGREEENSNMLQLKDSDCSEVTLQDNSQSSTVIYDDW